jgi:hypothetical protein
VADQIWFHDLAYLPRDHLALRLAVIEFIRRHPLYDHWRDDVVGKEDEEGQSERRRSGRRGRAEKKMADFLHRHSQPKTYTDEDGIMCQVIRGWFILVAPTFPYV